MEQKVPRRKSKKEYVRMLLNLVEKWQREGDTPEQAVEKLSPKQYDFLIDCGVDLDSLLLTEAQIKTIQEVRRAPRPLFPEGYSKKYPPDKQALYTAIVANLVENGATVTEKEKENFRDIHFSYGGVKYAIVLSCPRK